jgi:hypothetical protein
MGKMPELSAEPSNAELGTAICAVEGCVEEGKVATAEGFAAVVKKVADLRRSHDAKARDTKKALDLAAEKTKQALDQAAAETKTSLETAAAARAELRSGQQTIEGKLETVSGDVAVLKAFVEPWSDFFLALAKWRDKWRKRMGRLGGWVGKTVRWLAVTIVVAFVGSIITLGVTTVTTWLNTPGKAYVDAKTSDRYTRTEAERNNKALQAEIAALEKTAAANRKTLEGADHAANPAPRR